MFVLSKANFKIFFLSRLLPCDDILRSNRVYFNSVIELDPKSAALRKKKLENRIYYKFMQVVCEVAFDQNLLDIKTYPILVLYLFYNTL